MRRVGLALLVAVCCAMVAAAQTVTLSCSKIDPTTAGSFILQVRNTTTTAFRGAIIVFREPVIVGKPLVVNGGVVESVDGAGAVWKVTLAGATLVPGTGLLMVPFSTVTPVAVPGCGFVRAIYPLR